MCPTLEELESRQLLAGVTLITHGRLGHLWGFVQTAADYVTKRVGGPAQAPEYILKLTPDPGDGHLVPTITHVSGTGTPQTSSKGEIIVLLDWTSVDTNVSYPLSTVAIAVSNFWRNSSVDGVRLAELPLHELSISRGTGLLDEIAKSLGQAGVWVDQESYTDPNPVGANGDAPPTIYDNVAFVDNYWRTDGDPNNHSTNGQSVNGAYNLNVYWLDAESSGWALNHLLPGGYYNGTIDLTATNGGEGPIYTSWYGNPPTRPDRDKTGFYYSSIVGGPRPLSGVWAASGGTGARTATGQQGNQWANVTDLTANASTFATGQTITLSYLHQDRDDTSTIQFYLDNDRNPYDGFGKSLGSTVFAASGTISPGQFQTTADVGPGTYWASARITDTQGHQRFAYSKLITISGAVGAGYLSDLTPTSATSGWGPYEKDLSNGEQAAGDGHTITLNGVTYAKGLGVHAASDISFNLNQQYTQFASDVGVDDEVGNNGSVVFQVFLDGTKVFDSGIMRGTSTTQSVNLDVTGKSTLRLVVTNAGDGANYDHADWAAARVTLTNQPPPPPPPPPPSDTTYLSDLTPTSATNGWGPYEKDLSNGEQAAGDGHTITLNGVKYTKGLGTHAASDISFNLNKQYANFSSDVGVDDEEGTSGSVVFQVYLDGVKVFDSGVMTNSSATKTVSLDVTGKTTLRLVVTNAGDGNVSDHADWAGAKLTSTSQPPPPPPTGTTTYLSDLPASSATNGWGPYERDRSNGELGSADGQTVTLNGQTYAKGLGVHANSDISFNLNGQYKQFVSDVGVDDEVGNAGSVDFQVYINGIKAFDSGIMTGSSTTRTISLDVTGATILRLVVTDGGNGNDYDHADWAGAKVQN